MDNSQIDSAIKNLFDKPFLRGFRVLAIHRQTGLGESEIEDYLKHLVDIGRLTVEWEIPCKNCMTMLIKYHEKPESINETFCCSRCGTVWTVDIDDLQRHIFGVANSQNLPTDLLQIKCYNNIKIAASNGSFISISN